MFFFTKNNLADLVFAPTLACWSFRYYACLPPHYSHSRFSRQDLLLSRTMLTTLLVAYVDPFACDWLGFATTDLSHLDNKYYIIFLVILQVLNYLFALIL